MAGLNLREEYIKEYRDEKGRPAALDFVQETNEAGGDKVIYRRFCRGDGSTYTTVERIKGAAPIVPAAPAAPAAPPVAPTVTKQPTELTKKTKLKKLDIDDLAAGQRIAYKTKDGDKVGTVAKVTWRTVVIDVDGVKDTVIKKSDVIGLVVSE